jgi:hypothetical protein
MGAGVMETGSPEDGKKESYQDKSF